MKNPLDSKNSVNLVSLTRKSFCYLAAGITSGYVSRPKILSETLLRNDDDIFSLHASPTIPPSSAQIKATTELVDHLKNTLLMGTPCVLLHRYNEKTLCPELFFPEDILRAAWC